jgi:redox-sensitive bicupin YhaK (pirin superfamily)
MLALRPAAARGWTALDWLDSRHSFAFGDYLDPAHMGFRTLRVLNDDRIAPGGGFGKHPHRDMEIVTLVLAGALEHRDSLGNGSIIRPGDVQRMSAGTGIWHGEFNPSSAEPVHLLQIWLLPDQRGLPPDYEQRSFELSARRDAWQLLASRTGRDGAVTVHQDAEMLATILAPHASRDYALAEGRHAWVQVLRGRAALNELPLAAGDGVAIGDETQLRFRTEGEEAEVLLFDLA